MEMSFTALFFHSFDLFYSNCMVGLMILIVLFCYVGCGRITVEVVAVVTVLVEAVVLRAVLRKLLLRARNPMWIWLQF
jgi:hypothetical protein